MEGLLGPSIPQKRLRLDLGQEEFKFRASPSIDSFFGLTTTKLIRSILILSALDLKKLI